MKVGVINYQAGNLRSVETALRCLGADFIVDSEPDELRKTDTIIFPGVGEARAAMTVLNKTGLDQLIRETVKAGKPLLGICIGCQVIMEHSEERDTACLGIIPGEVKRFPADMGLKGPHMGWNRVKQRQKHRLFDHIPDESSFYFVHSYYPSPAQEKMLLSTTDYGFDFASGVVYENVAAVQFHPEKSGRYGLTLLENFLNF